LPTGARWPVSGSVGSILYCRSFVQQPQRIILDMDDIDDPSSNSPWCAVTATTAPSPAGVAESHVPRLHDRLRQAQSSRASRRHSWAPTCASPTLEGRGKALYEKSSGRENLIEERLDAVPAWFAHLQAAAQLEARGTEVFAQVGTTFETIRRTFVKIAVRVVELKGVIKISSGHQACGDDGAITTRGQRSMRHSPR
jgi:hypothetical protein